MTIKGTFLLRISLRSFAESCTALLTGLIVPIRGLILQDSCLARAHTSAVDGWTSVLIGLFRGVTLETQTAEGKSFSYAC